MEYRACLMSPSHTSTNISQKKPTWLDFLKLDSCSQRRSCDSSININLGGFSPWSSSKHPSLIPIFSHLRRLSYSNWDSAHPRWESVSFISDSEGQTTSESSHLYPPVQESSYGSPFTPAKRPKRKVAPKRRQERPVAPPKKRRRKIHRMDHYAAETRQDKVSLSIVPKLCGGQVWVEGCLQCLGWKIGWASFRKLWCVDLGFESRRMWYFRG